MLVVRLLGVLGIYMSIHFQAVIFIPSKSSKSADSTILLTLQVVLDKNIVVEGCAPSTGSHWWHLCDSPQYALSSI